MRLSRSWRGRSREATGKFSCRDLAAKWSFPVRKLLIVCVNLLDTSGDSLCATSIKQTYQSTSQNRLTTSHATWHFSHRDTNERRVLVVPRKGCRRTQVVAARRDWRDGRKLRLIVQQT